MAAHNCSLILPSPSDAVPARAPLDLYSALAQRVAGLSVVVIGDPVF